MASVSVRNVTKVFPAKRAREIAANKEVDLEIPNRQLVVVAGPSGAGKSTLLRLIAGLESVSQGNIFIDEKRVTDLAPKERDIAMVFQNGALLPHANVYENVAFGLRLRKFASTEIKKRVQEAASILGIESLLKQKPKALTPEQRRRVEIARAISRQSKILLLDEPLARLEARAQGELRAEMIKLHQRLQATMILTTSDPIEAMMIGERVVMMDSGTVQQDGAPFGLYDEPANLVVAGFFGQPPMNFIAGTLKSEGEKIRFRENEGGTIDLSIPASERPTTERSSGRNVILGIRPEDLKVSIPSGNQARAPGLGFPGIIDLVEPRGQETDLHIQTGAHTLICRSRNPFDRREVGHRVQLQIDVAKAHLFDPATSGRLG